MSSFDFDFQIDLRSKASIVSVICPQLEGHKTEKESAHSFNELKELLRTLGISVVSETTQTRKELDAGTMVGRGKLEEIAELAKQSGAELLVFDFELTSSQIKNIRNITGLDTIDRCHVILEIFARHARTKESKIQIEIARLQYLLPRLTGMWSHFSRQRGGVGVRGGEGEQQIELDRRIIRRRIEFYKRELEVVRESRLQQKKRRQQETIVAALVGYTNAGKSSVMNRLCQVSVLEEDKLFATLDSTYRMLNPDTKPPMIFVDTVGFISNLPNTLIDGFKTTLESALEADLLIQVCDLSDPNYEKHLRVTSEVLKELNVGDKPTFLVFNKKDLVENPLQIEIVKRKFENCFVVSSHDKQDMKNLRNSIIQYFLSFQECFDLFIPYDLGNIHAKIMSKTNIEAQSSHEKGIYYRVRVPHFIASNLGIEPFILAPKDALAYHEASV